MTYSHILVVKVYKDYFREIETDYKMVYRCERCHYEGSKKSHLLAHLKRKYTCDALYSDVSCETLLRCINEPVVCERKTYQCKICDSSFAHLSSLSRHVKNDHQDAHTNTQQSITTNHTTNISSSNNNNISNNTNINSNNNTTNNVVNNTTNNITVVLLPFGKEDLAHVENDNEFLQRCFTDLLGSGIADIVEKIYYDPAKKENHNVRLKRTKDPSTMMVYMEDAQGNRKWVERETNDTIEKMIKKGTDILVKFNELTCYIPGDADSRDRYEHRHEKLFNVRTRKKGFYVRVKNSVYLKTKAHRSRQ